jgi:hypothetical protein
MPLPQEYEEQFKKALSRRTYGEKTQKTYRSMFRRMCRDLNVSDLSNPGTLIWYRWQMPKGSMSIFSAIWSILRDTEIGSHLHTAPPKPHVLYPHPLYADVMHLGAIYGNAMLSELKWSDAENHFLFDQRAAEARRRVFEWFMGSDDAPDEDLPLVVCNRAGRPMQLWQVEAIVNSPTANKDHQRKYKREAIAPFLTEVIAMLTALNASAAQLREACDLIAKIGVHSELFLFKDALADLRACDNAHQMLEIVRMFPQDPYDETPALW